MQHEREQPAQVTERPPHRVLQAVAAHLALDEVRDDLSVGLGHEDVPLALQLALQIQVVLDDPVVHDDDAPRAVAVGVRVLLRGTSVRGPARVAHAVLAVERMCIEIGLEPRQLARAAPDFDLPVTHHGDARGVVPAVFEAPEPVDEHGKDRFRTDVANDAAHHDS